MATHTIALADLVTSPTIRRVVFISQAAYDAIPSPESTTAYLVIS